jgi:hypothetical protein
MEQGSGGLRRINTAEVFSGAERDLDGMPSAVGLAQSFSATKAYDASESWASEPYAPSGVPLMRKS